MDTWPAPTAQAPVTATVPVPGSKSLTNRALVLAALSTRTAPGATSTVRGALRSRDTDLMIGALRTLGLRVDDDGGELRIGAALGASPGTRIDCGLAGTVLRFVPPLAALGCRDVVFDGDEQARSRPIAPLLGAMRTLGIDIDGERLPFQVRGHGAVAGGDVSIDASASSQFVSALLLAGASFTDGISVEHTGPALPSAPHIAMTVAMLRHAGVAVDDGTTNRWRVSPGPVSARDWVIEPDLSNALPFLAAGVITGGTVRIPNWPAVSMQPIGQVAKILSLVNATTSIVHSRLEVRGGGAYRGYGGFEVDLRAVGELTPTVAALAALAIPGSVSHLTGIAHLRGHETDRLAALSAELNRLGGDCAETGDGLVITAVPLRGGVWRSYADHRMATAAAILGLSVPGIEVDDIATTAKTLPDFPRMWAAMLGRGVPEERER